MNHCGIHQNNTFTSSREEMRSSVSVSLTFGNGEPMVFPKPRRIGLFTGTTDLVRPLRWQMCYQSKCYESKAGLELLDIIFAKGGGYGASSEQTCTRIASSPPFFSGSPPSRVSNPLIQDTLFGGDKISLVSPRSMIPNPLSSGMSSSSPSSSARKGGCLRANFSNKPAVTVEGFDCLDRENCCNCSITALA